MCVYYLYRKKKVCRDISLKKKEWLIFKVWEACLTGNKKKCISPPVVINSSELLPEYRWSFDTITLSQRICAVYPAANPGVEISSSWHLLPGPDTTDFSLLGWILDLGMSQLGKSGLSGHFLCLVLTSSCETSLWIQHSVLPSWVPLSPAIPWSPISLCWMGLLLPSGQRFVFRQCF